MKKFYGFLKKRELLFTLRQLLLIMKLTAVLLTVVSLGVNARGFSQTVTYSGKNVLLEKVFSAIEQQTGYVFFYNDADMAHSHKVTVSLKKTSLETALKKVLKGQQLKFTILGRTIFIHSISGNDLQAAKAILADTVITVQGRVSDSATGNPLVGVTIKVKNNNAGVTTNAQGNYSITVPDDAVLEVSYVGYRTQEISVNGKEDIDIILNPSLSELNQLVVVGYGSQKRSDLTGSISSINGEEVTHLPTQRVDQALQGRAAGIMVLNTDGSPGGNTTVRIRGINSINGGNDALVVIDGLQGGNLSALNPNDIASIEILKDASATAIYGSQGANGVILITTKTGKSGKPIINYNYDISIASLRKKLDLLNAADYARNINAVTLSQNGNGINPKPIFSDAEIQSFEKNNGTDWQDVIYRTAISQNHQLSVGGATDRLSYRVSGGYLDQEGILLNSGYNRFSLRVNVRADVTKWASFGINWDGAKEKTNSILFGGSTDWPNNPIGAAYRFSPTIPVYDSSGNYSKAALHYGNPTLWNPLASTVEPLNINTTKRNNVNAFLEFKILEGLTLKIRGGAILANINNLNFLNTKTFIGLQNNGSAENYEDKSEYYQNSNILTYDKTFDKHHLTFTALAEQKYSKDYSSTINASDFLNQQTTVYDLAGANIRNIQSYYSERVINSYMGRINYVYANKYLLTASYRADGSSVFGKNNKWGYFPSAAVAWRMSQENFIRDLNFFSNLKLRASWGITGNQAISPYETLAKISSGGNYPYDGSDADNLGFYISSAANPDLKWESTTQIDIGIDAAIFNGRLTLTADYYKKTTKDLLMPRELPSYTGLSSIIDNVGSMGNKGIELAIAGDPVAGGDFSWHSGINISANRTTVLDLGQDDKIGYRSGGSGQGVNKAFMYLVEGQPFGQMYGWRYEGVWGTDQAKEAAAYGQLPGDPHYFDKNQDNKINMEDTTVIGNSMPRFIFGWSNRITYKNFDLTFLVQGKQGNDIFNVARIALDAPDGTSVRLLNRWTPQNQNSDIPAIIDERTRENAQLVSTISFPPSTGNTTSYYVEDASYIRLKNITLTYNFPASMMNKIRLNSLSIYASATNLITLTDYTGYEPEVSSFNDNDAQIGSDYNNYPSSMIFNFGLKVSF